MRGFPHVLQFSSISEHQPLSKSKAKGNIVTLYLLRKKEFWPWKGLIAKEVFVLFWFKMRGLLLELFSVPFLRQKAKLTLILLEYI